MAIGDRPALGSLERRRETRIAAGAGSYLIDRGPEAVAPPAEQAERLERSLELR
ncbi:hypothetical protein [Sphingobium sp. YBL2]|uniref:hypothetical protein n=1 Tax=Sphingobium sp. (strain YBL2) TaxID=484429 RepID=UPI000A923F44|nr:hypothetical protein [Sphingobium sp. YBL2]